MRALAALLVAVAALGQQTFRSGVEEVVVSVTVHGEGGRIVTDLGRDDFRLFDDGARVSITQFATDRRAVRIILLLDTSASMTDSVSELRSVATAFIRVLGPEDAVRMGTFNNILKLAPEFTSDQGELLRVLPTTRGAHTTRLYDVLVEACGAFDVENERRVVIVLSDGADTASTETSLTVKERAAEAEVTVYGVGLNSRFVEQGRPIVRAPDPALRDIAEDSGGGYLAVGSGADLTDKFRSIVRELHQEYLLGFTPTRTDGKVHPLLVRVLRPNVTVRARRHYFAPAR